MLWLPEKNGDGRVCVNGNYYYRQITKLVITLSAEVMDASS